LLLPRPLHRIPGVKTFSFIMQFKSPYNLQPPPQSVPCQLAVLTPEGPRKTERFLGAKQIDGLTWEVTFEYDEQDSGKTQLVNLTGF